MSKHVIPDHIRVEALLAGSGEDSYTNTHLIDGNDPGKGNGSGYVALCGKVSPHHAAFTWYRSPADSPIVPNLWCKGCLMVRTYVASGHVLPQ